MTAILSNASPGPFFPEPWPSDEDAGSVLRAERVVDPEIERRHVDAGIDSGTIVIHEHDAAPREDAEQGVPARAQLSLKASFCAPFLKAFCAPFLASFRPTRRGDLEDLADFVAHFFIGVELGAGELRLIGELQRVAIRPWGRLASAQAISDAPPMELATPRPRTP